MANLRQVQYLLDKLKSYTAILQPTDRDTHMPTCYLCLKKIDDSPWEIKLEDKDSKEVFSLDSICAHSLLSAADLEHNTQVICPNDYDQHHIDRQYYKKRSQLQLAANSYSKKRLAVFPNTSSLPDCISQSQEQSSEHARVLHLQDLKRNA